MPGIIVKWANRLDGCHLGIGVVGPETSSANSTEHAVDGYTALHWAVENGDLEMVNLLLAHSADPNIAASFDKHSGVTPLHLASQVKVCSDVNK